MTARNGHSDWISSVQLSSSGVMVTAATPTIAGTNPIRLRASAYQQHANTHAHSTGTIVRRSRSDAEHRDERHEHESGSPTGTAAG